MVSYKIIFTGPPGAGKTSALSTLSDIAVVEKKLVAGDNGEDGQTPASMDYGLVNLADGASIHLYGTPTQEYIDVSLETLIEDGIGLVLLIDNSRPKPFADLRCFVKTFREFIDQTALVIGVTKTDTHAAPSVEDYHQELKPLGLVAIPVFEVDTRQRKDISLLVEALLCSIAPSF